MEQHQRCRPARPRAVGRRRPRAAPPARRGGVGRPRRGARRARQRRHPHRARLRGGAGGCAGPGGRARQRVCRGVGPHGRGHRAGRRTRPVDRRGRPGGERRHRPPHRRAGPAADTCRTPGADRPCHTVRAVRAASAGRGDRTGDVDRDRHPGGLAAAEPARPRQVHRGAARTGPRSPRHRGGGGGGAAQLRPPLRCHPARSPDPGAAVHRAPRHRQHLRARHRSGPGRRGRRVHPADLAVRPDAAPAGGHRARPTRRARRAGPPCPPGRSRQHPCRPQRPPGSSPSRPPRRRHRRCHPRPPAA